MHKTRFDNSNESFLAVDTSTLQKQMCCGYRTAVKIGMNANARIQIGKRVLWNVAKVQAYLDSISEGECV